MTAAVCIGFRARNEHEAAVFRWVHTRWSALGYPVHVGDRPGPYNRSAARNAAAAQATDADILIFVNADTVYLDPAPIAAVVDNPERRWFLPVDYVETSASYTTLALDADPDEPMRDPFSSYDRYVQRTPAGYQIVPADWFYDVGGWDEGFGAGWGWEDAALRDALDVLHAPHERAGCAVHLWHPRGPELAPSANRANRVRWNTRYRRAATQRSLSTRTAMMRAAIQHRP